MTTHPDTRSNEETPVSVPPVLPAPEPLPVDGQDDPATSTPGDSPQATTASPADEGASAPAESETAPTEDAAAPTESGTVPTQDAAALTEPGTTPTEDAAVLTESGTVPTATRRPPGDVEITEFDGGPDTVQRADATPEELQPWAELGLRVDEYDRIRQILGRRPTQAELAMYSIMWSEHCSYKSSKVHLRQFTEKAPPSERMLAGIGENAGVIQVSEKLAVTFKVESHNHPSFVEPYQGAATGVGGIVRDILAMGARPVAVMDPLRFGAAEHPDTARVLPGVVAGIGGYGNCLGLPNIGGELVFDPCYQGNPLVNALCVGVLPVDRLQRKEAAGPGNVVVLLGAKTGRDGIGGVSVLASATFDDSSQQRRPSVQVGDPFIEKLLIESCLELYDRDLVVGIQDLGGAGLTCALTETAAAASTGMRVWLERVPLREPSMDPHEILASESQERMLLIVAPEKLDRVLRIADKWGVLATAIGEVTAAEPEQNGSSEPGRLVITWQGHTVVDVPPGSLVDDGPVYARPMREPADLILLRADRAETLPRPIGSDQLRETVLRMIATPNLCDKTWVTEQYDRYVLGNTILAQPEDAGIIRIDEESGLGVVLSVDGNGRYARLDPYIGAQLALAEAYRNVAVTGGRPIAVTDCLNFGSPEDPSVMWQFAEAVRGLADGCAELGIPVTGGNVSFYNQTGAAAIHPTPVVGVLGLIEDVAQRVPIGFTPPAHTEGDFIFLLGETYDELSGSEWAWATHRHLGGEPPHVDLARERVLAAVLAEAARVGHLAAAHDISDGGLIQSLVESTLRRGIGARIALPEEFSSGSLPFVYLFSESAGRALVAVPRGQEKAFTALCEDYGLPWAAIGVTDANSGALELRDHFSIDLTELRTAHTGTLPALFGGNRQSTEAVAPIAADPAPDAEAPAEGGLPVAASESTQTEPGGIEATGSVPPEVTPDSTAPAGTGSAAAAADIRPTDAPPTKAAPSLPPTDATPTDATQTDVTPTDAAPADAAPADAAQTDVTSIDGASGKATSGSAGGDAEAGGGEPKANGNPEAVRKSRPPRKPRATAKPKPNGKPEGTRPPVEADQADEPAVKPPAGSE